MQSEQVGQPFVKTQSLWRLIECRINEYERIEVKAILGESIVDQTLELHDEVDALLNIWEEYRDITLKENASIRLPEPPEVRQLLGQEINFFVETLRERAVMNGLDPKSILKCHKAEIIAYAANVNGTDSCPPPPKPTAVAIYDGRQTPCVADSSLDRATRAQIVGEDLVDMSDKLNLFKFDEVVEHFRSVLQNEVTQLGEDIILLQNCLEEEANFRSESSLAFAHEPTLSELKAERSSLEQEVMKSHISIPTPPNIRPKSTAVPALRKPLGSASSKISCKSPSHVRQTATKYAKDSDHTKTRVTNNRSSTAGTDCVDMAAGSKVGNTRHKAEVGDNRYVGKMKEISSDKTSAGIDDDYSIKGGKALNGEAAKIAVVSIGGGPPTVCVASLGEATVMVPSQPTVCQPRPGSAARFRRMVHSCRDDT